MGTTHLLMILLPATSTGADRLYPRRPDQPPRQVFQMKYQVYLIGADVT